MTVSEKAQGLTFPCIIDVKVFLSARENNLELVRDVLLQSISSDELESIDRKQSKHGKYHSFSCRVKAASRQRMDQLYIYLSSHPEILMVI